MELFAKLFSSLLVFVYHCFDRIVINGYLSGISRPDQVVYFFRNVIGVPVVDKEALSHRAKGFVPEVEIVVHEAGCAAGPGYGGWDRQLGTWAWSNENWVPAPCFGK